MTRLHHFVVALTGPLAAIALALTTPAARAFPHVVQEGETLAGLAERFYGRIQNERVLVVANGLDRGTTTTIVPGMLLDIPALSHHRVVQGDTWASLGKSLLGAPRRGEFLALFNDTKPWIQPEPGRILRVPYNLALVSTGQDSLPTIAYRYLGSTKHAWSISHYNHLEEKKLARGDVFLVPVTELELTEVGRRAAARAALTLSTEADAPQRALQERIQHEVPALTQDVRAGRYVPAVSRGVRLLASAELAELEQARIHRQLLEAYVALDAVGQAVDSCAAWRRLDPSARLDPVVLSPKILAACERVPESATRAPSEPTPTAPTTTAPAAPARTPTAPTP